VLGLVCYDVLMERRDEDFWGADDEERRELAEEFKRLYVEQERLKASNDPEALKRHIAALCAFQARFEKRLSRR